MKEKKYIKRFVLFSLIIFSVILYLKYIIDPVGINNKYELGLFKDEGLDQRLKKFISLKEYKPNTIILGGSRVHYMQTKDLYTYTKDAIFNIGMPYSTLEEQYYFLKYSLENFKINNVLIGINLYAFSNEPKEQKIYLDKNLFESNFHYDNLFLHYLKVPIISYLDYIYSAKDKLKYAYYENGSITPYHESITLQTQKEIRFKYSIEGYRNTYKNYLDIKENNNSFKYLKEMIDLCKKYNVKYNVFTTVVQTKQLELIKEVKKEKEYYFWKEELSKITPYWDFMYKSEFSDNEEYYIDTSHIRHNYYYNYLETIYNKKNTNIGKFVNKENIKEHIEFLKKQNEF